MARAWYSPAWACVVLISALLLSLLHSVDAVKHGDFKTCDQSGFCKRNRHYADTAKATGSGWVSPYTLDASTIKLDGGKLTGMVFKTIEGSTELIRLPLIMSFLKSGVARLEIDEEKRQKGEIELRHDSKIRKERYNEAANWAIVGGLDLDNPEISATDEKQTVVKYGPGKSYEALIFHNPFSVDFVRDGKVHVQLNGRGYMNVEHWRAKIEKKVEEPKEGEAKEPEPSTESDTLESTWWEETFGGNTDSKPRGPESIAMDITFPEYQHVFGIPSHAGPLSLRETRGGGEGKYSEPYRMYNSDVFEYEMDSPMTLYGAIPFMQAHRKNSTVGVFWLNGAETWVDIVKNKHASNPLSLGTSGRTDTETHWISETGVLDVFVLLGPSPKDIIKSYSELTGTTSMPPQFAIAYHQCRWNYVTDEDVKDVDRKFDKFNIPYDVIWLDIEYTDGKKYFTWDEQTFPDPLGMQKQLDGHERKLVAIIDPHIKNAAGYHVSDELKSKDLAVKDKSGKDIYQGWCWPGDSHWSDCFNPATRKWFEGLYKYTSWKGSATNTFVWNDMNEPSVFNGPEVTMPKDNVHHGGWEHRDLHNINGMTFHNASYTGLLRRDKVPKRPFVLTRSFFAGSQRLSAMWTGDNQADWSHLVTSIPMVLSLNVAGYPFSGADVGGFFGNPSPELLTRWYQAGIFYPFLRAHAHIDTRRREPYLTGEPYTEIITRALRLRYSLLPVWYTAFYESSKTGAPVVRPNYYVHPDDETGFAIDDQLYVGSSGLLTKPVTKEGDVKSDVYISDDEKYYDYFDYSIVSGAGKTHTLDAPLDKITLLMQGGHIIPRKDRPRKSSGLMKWDPYTLVVVLDNLGNANGTLYVDDGESYDFTDGANIYRLFKFDSHKQSLSSSNLGANGKKTKEFVKTMASVKIERIIIVAAPNDWKSKSTVSINQDGKEKQLELTWHAGDRNKASWAVVRNPDVPISSTWSIAF